VHSLGGQPAGDHSLCISRTTSRTVNTSIWSTAYLDAGHLSISCTAAVVHCLPAPTGWQCPGCWIMALPTALVVTGAPTLTIATAPCCAVRQPPSRAPQVCAAHKVDRRSTHHVPAAAPSAAEAALHCITCRCLPACLPACPSLLKAQQLFLLLPISTPPADIWQYAVLTVRASVM
jgi:hypothetical protein